MESLMMILFTDDGLDSVQCSVDCKYSIEVIATGVLLSLLIVVMLSCFGFQYYRRKEKRVLLSLNDEGKRIVLLPIIT